jgi:hypothetical protein
MLTKTDCQHIVEVFAQVPNRPDREGSWTMRSVPGAVATGLFAGSLDRSVDWDPVATAPGTDYLESVSEARP